MVGLKLICFPSTPSEESLLDHLILTCRMVSEICLVEDNMHPASRHLFPLSSVPSRFPRQNTFYSNTTINGNIIHYKITYLVSGYQLYPLRGLFMLNPHNNPHLTDGETKLREIRLLSKVIQAVNGGSSIQIQIDLPRAYDLIKDAMLSFNL